MHAGRLEPRCRPLSARPSPGVRVVRFFIGTHANIGLPCPATHKRTVSSQRTLQAEQYVPLFLSPWPLPPSLLQYPYRCLKMKSLLALLLTVTSVLAHPVPEPEPIPANVTMARLLKRAGAVLSSCTVPNTVALTYINSYILASPTYLRLVASMTAHITTWYFHESLPVCFAHFS